MTPLTPEEQLLQHTQAINGWKLRRARHAPGTKNHKWIQAIIDDMETEVVRDKDGNSIALAPKKAASNDTTKT